MVYVHPWEIDPDQPRISSSWRSRFRHYQNLATTENKIINLLSDFSFSTMEQVLAGLDLDPNFVLTGAQPLVGAS
jgi:hypothetical protein